MVISTNGGGGGMPSALPPHTAIIGGGSSDGDAADGDWKDPSYGSKPKKKGSKNSVVSFVHMSTSSLFVSANQEEDEKAVGRRYRFNRS